MKHDIIQSSNLHYSHGLYTRYYNGTVADQDELTVANGVAGWGFVQAGDNEAYGHFTFSSIGTVILLADCSANTVNTNTPDNLCIYNDSGSISVRNRLGSSKTIKLVLHFS